MKKTLVILLLTALVAPVFAGYSLNGHVGILSGAGFTNDLKKWEINETINSSFPVMAGSLNKVLELVDYGTDLKGKDLMNCGTKLYLGLNSSLLYKIADSKKSTVSVGPKLVLSKICLCKELDIVDGIEDIFVALAEAEVKYTYHINKHNGLFTSFGVPLFGLIHIFEKKDNMDSAPINIWIEPSMYHRLSEGRKKENLGLLAFGGITAMSLQLGYVYTF